MKLVLSCNDKKEPDGFDIDKKLDFPAFFLHFFNFAINSILYSKNMRSPLLMSKLDFQI